tara:strand:+ start:11149 stop:12057 length:909 start_codon:yes stop_codon:yes gene_type:complete
MAYKKHPRHTTNVQLSKDTTADGSRIDDGLDEMVDHFNRIPVGDIKTRYTPSTFVMGWSPQDPGVADTYPITFPWMRAINDPSDKASNSQGDPEINNRQRLKGYDVPGIFSDRPAATDSNGVQYIWTTSLFFKNSVTIDSIYLLMTEDGVGATLSPYDADWTWPGTLTPAQVPPGVTSGDSATDMSIALHVDHIYKTEERSLNAVELQKRNFKITAQSIRNTTGAASFPMTPTYPGGTIDGHYSKIKANTPIPERSRVRLSVCIPDYTLSRFGGSTDAPWKIRPWFRQCFHLSMVVLEEITD